MTTRLAGLTSKSNRIAKGHASSKLPNFRWANGNHFEDIDHTGDSLGTTLYAKGFRPWLLAIPGRPPTSLAGFRHECLPSVKVVRIIYDDGAELRSFGEWDDPQDKPQDELEDLLRALLRYEDDDEWLYPDGTKPECDVRYDRKAVGEPRVSSELCFTTLQGSRMTHRRTAASDALLGEGDAEVVGDVVPVSRVACPLLAHVS